VTTLSEQNIATEVARIMKMNNEELRRTWRTLLGKEAPKWNTKILRQRLAWEVQALVFGGFTDEAKKMLRRARIATAKNKKIPQPKTCRLPPGTRLAREYRDEEHVVVATTDGFEYNGQIYQSLTRITEVITGSRWNGPAFFGLREKPRRRRKK
jgi:hypothetical protein